MSGYTTTLPAFVRTEAGSVRVEAGEQIPAETSDTEIARLVAGGVIVEGQSEPAPATDDEGQSEPVPVDDAATAPTPSGGNSRGQSGSKRGR